MFSSLLMLYVNRIEEVFVNFKALYLFRILQNLIDKVYVNVETLYPYRISQILIKKVYVNFKSMYPYRICQNLIHSTLGQMGIFIKAFKTPLIYKNKKEKKEHVIPIRPMAEKRCYNCITMYLTLYYSRSWF